MDRWLSGQGQEVVDPELYTRNNLTDGVFIPGLLSFGAPMSSAPPTDHATAGSVTGVRIHMRDGVITIGDESGSKAIGLDGDDSDGGMLLFTPNVVGVSAAVLAYVPPPGPYPPPAPPIVQIPLSAKLTASASQAKAK
jgi:hypothetical protein